MGGGRRQKNFEKGKKISCGRDWGMGCKGQELIKNWTTPKQGTVKSSILAQWNNGQLGGGALKILVSAGNGYHEKGEDYCHWTCLVEIEKRRKNHSKGGDLLEKMCGEEWKRKRMVGSMKKALGRGGVRLKAPREVRSQPAQNRVLQEKWGSSELPLLRNTGTRKKKKN